MKHSKGEIITVDWLTAHDSGLHDTKEHSCEKRLQCFNLTDGRPESLRIMESTKVKKIN